MKGEKRIPAGMPALCDPSGVDGSWTVDRWCRAAAGLNLRLMDWHPFGMREESIQGLAWKILQQD